MSTSFHGASGPSGHAGSRSVLGQPAQISPEQSMFNQLRKLTQSVEALRTQQEESSREQIDTLLEQLDKLGAGVNNADGVHRLRTTQSDALLAAVERIKDKLRDALTRVDYAGCMGSDYENVVSKLMDEIRAAIVDCESLVLASTIPGESPPPAPRACFGRDELIEAIVGFAENLTPTALIGAGGIGKTSIALTVLYHHRVKQRFGENRRFIRCDQFPATLTHLLNRLSNVTGAGIENPKDLASLHQFLSSREMVIVLDNAESILDPRGIDAAEIYALVEELCRLETICLCITSRISTIPTECEIVDIPTLPMNAALDTFYRIYKKREQSNLIRDILEQLDSHPLSIVLLATVGHQNRWSTERLTKEWEARRTSVLQTQHNNSLAATIELSLTSPMFQELGAIARELLGVIAFFPQGVDENNLDWLFPTISNGTGIFDGFCVLSLAYRSNGFVTMLAPLRDYLRPNDPKSSSLLCATKECYFARMSVDVDPEKPGFRESRWITSEDVNVEHLLDVFTTIDTNSDDIWDACANFINHLCWHKSRPTLLRPKIERLPDDHRSKPDCLFGLSGLSDLVGNNAERKRLLIHTLKLWKERGSDHEVARVLRNLSEANRMLDFPKEGIEQAEEALKITERLGDTFGQAQCLIKLAYLFQEDGQLDAGEEAASRAIDLASEKGYQFIVCESHSVLGDIYQPKGEMEKAVHHYKLALEIASPFDWHIPLFWVNYALAALFRDQGRINDAHAHINQAKSYTANSVYNLGRATELHADIWYKQHRLEEAKSEALRAVDIYEKLGAMSDIEDCRKLLQDIQKELDSPVASDRSDSGCAQEVN